MKKKMGRPKLGTQNAKGELLAVRVTPLEAGGIKEAIRRSGLSKPDWLRKALLSSAAGDKVAS